ncbi:ABC transporter ATP-binding protein [Pleionea sediminis]|uniref:ABC transporter ATP-binding protein n=1 Tax=Pleionea sediminis TaxID=2569479 RepID=UPI001186994B|nr:ABC transporter ATP-binding protein [Pleionea sediminis]
MILLKDVCKTYELGETPLKALDHVNLSINPGDYLSVMGPSGSGKSTLLNMIGLLDRPDSGELYINDIATHSLIEEERAKLRQNNIGFIFQSFHLIPRLTALENVEVPLMLSKTPKHERREQSMKILEQLGISSRADHLPKQLSGGQLQRVAIARALLMKPSILLADEPTGNLDSRSGSEVIELLEKFNQEGITLMMVTHDVQLGSRAPRKLQIIDGKLSEVEKHHAFS